MAAGEVVQGDQLWPFGKYQGQPIDRVMADHSYLEWVLNQPWFAEDYARLHGLIVNFGNEAQDSPEHNAFQIRFLEEEMRLAVARRLGFEELDGEFCGKQKAIARRIGRELNCRIHEKESPLRVSAVKFEESGWDVAFDILPASYVAFIDASHGQAYVEFLDSVKKHKQAELNRNRLKAHHGTLDVAVYEPNKARRPRVLVELKPDLGDDYPSVLRQIQRYPGGENESFAETGRVRGRSRRPLQFRDGREVAPSRDRKILIARRARFTTVTLEQVRAFFASASVELILEHELQLRQPELDGVVDAEIVDDGDLRELTDGSSSDRTGGSRSRPNGARSGATDRGDLRVEPLVDPGVPSGDPDSERFDRASEPEDDEDDELFDSEFLEAERELDALEKSPVGRAAARTSNSGADVLRTAPENRSAGSSAVLPVVVPEAVIGAETAPEGTEDEVVGLAGVVAASPGSRAPSFGRDSSLDLDLPTDQEVEDFFDDDELFD